MRNIRRGDLHQRDSTVIILELMLHQVCASYTDFKVLLISFSSLRTVSFKTSALESPDFF